MWVLKSHKAEVFCILAALTFAFNGIVAKVVLLSGLDAWHLTQIRVTGAFLILGSYYFIFKRHELKATKSELPWLLAFGIVGVCIVQSFYFTAIQRINISVALIIEFTAPIWIVIWVRFVRKVNVRKEMWIAIVLAFVGLVLLAQVWEGVKLDVLGLSAAFVDAFALAGYFLIGKRLSATKSGGALTVWGMGIATVVWAIVLPIWNFPSDVLNKNMDLLGIFSGNELSGWLLVLWVIVMGTIVPYILGLLGLGMLSASTTSVIGMLEPVLAGLFAWWWLGEVLNGVQLLGAIIVLIGIYLADKYRMESEARA